MITQSLAYEAAARVPEFNFAPFVALEEDELHDAQTVASAADSLRVAALMQPPPEPRTRLARTHQSWYENGIALLAKNDLAKATVAFRHAYELEPDDPLTMSYFGLVLALDKHHGREGLRLCEEAVRRDAYRVELFHNLGRVYLLSGRRKKARLALLRGAAIDKRHRETHEEIQAMGERKSPVFGFLERSHPANIAAGKTLHRLGLR